MPLAGAGAGAGSTVASTVIYATPIWSTLLGAAFLAESVSWATAVGAVVIVGGVVLTRAGGARTAPATQVSSGRTEPS